MLEYHAAYYEIEDGWYAAGSGRATRLVVLRRASVSPHIPTRVAPLSYVIDRMVAGMESRNRYKCRISMEYSSLSTPSNSRENPQTSSARTSVYPPAARS